MRICALKGEKPDGSDGRVSYSTKSDVAKLCLSSYSSMESYAIVEAAVDEDECTNIMKKDANEQGKFAEVATSTTSTTTVTEESSDESDEAIATVDCDCDDGYVGQFLNGECSCEPAPCDVVGTVGKGLDCQCMPGLSGVISWFGATAQGECIIDAKDLFTDGSMKVWEYKGKAIKCCVPTVVAPTELQDMNEETLPSIGSSGRFNKTGCGYMFGDHYHNGMKPYKARTESTCPVSIEKIMQITGESLEEVKYILNLHEAV